MSNSDKKGEAAQGDTAQASDTTAASGAPIRRIDIVCRKPIKIGGRQIQIGEKLGEVSLADGVSLNVLVDAVRHEFAHERPDKKRPRS